MEKEQVVEGKKTALENLQVYLAQAPSGGLDSTTYEEAERLLCLCWDELKFLSWDANLYAYKLLNRTEGLTWNPPLLTFKIERHAGTMNGSIYADVYSWSVNVELGTAVMDEYPEKRQVGERAKPLKVEPIADEILGLLLKHKNDERLKWSEDGSQVTLLLNKIIPANNWKTKLGRKVRFWRAFEKKAQQHGLEAVSTTITEAGRYLRIPARVSLRFKTAWD